MRQDAFFTIVMSPVRLLAGLLVIVAVTTSASVRSAAEDPDFYRDVRPILAKNCFQCHGPDEETREANLRLDRPEGLFGLIDGRTVVVRGDADHSELMKRVQSSDPDDQMPPTDSGKSLTATQKDTLSRWIAAGAPWNEHWAFVAPVLPEVPLIAGDSPANWSHQEIDRFVLRKQVAAGLQPSPRAEPEILVRRVFLDLIGLPPTVEEADRWIARLTPDAVTEASDSAWAELVDHLLTRPEYGERWARLWLDLARYADTNGYEKDRPRSIWPYRDWVIRALNDDMPFDQFTIEQIAGDLIPDATVSQRIATGFHRNTMLNEEGGIDPLEFRFHAMTDRVATTGTVWLGLTVGCAQCHTHKYDPLTHREYYQLMAFLNNADEPSLALPDVDLQRSAEANRKEAAKLLEELPSLWPLSTFDSVPAKIVTATSIGGETVTVQPDGEVIVTGSLPKVTAYTIDLEVDAPASIEAIRLEAFRAKGQKGPGRAMNGNFVLSEVQISLVLPATPAEDSETVYPIAITTVNASAQQTDYAANLSIDGKPDTGWGIDTGSGIPEKVEATFTLNAKQLRTLWKEHSNTDSKPILRVQLLQNVGGGHFLGAFRLSTGHEMAPVDSAEQRRKIVQQKFAEWLTLQRRDAVAWTPMVPTSVSSNMPHLTVLGDNSILATGDTTKQDRYEIVLAPSKEPVTALRLEALPDERLPGNGPGTTYYEGSLGDFYLNEFSVFAGDEKAPLTSATESYTKNKFGNTPASAALTLDGDVQTGWSVAGREGERHTAVYLFEHPFPAGTAMKIRMIFGRHFASSLGRFRISSTDSHSKPVAKKFSDADEQLLATPDDQLTESERTQLLQTFLMNSQELSVPAERIRNLLSPPDFTTTLVMQERPAENPRPTFRHHRGEYLQTREPLDAVSPESLHRWPEELPRDRLGFAKWLVHRTNPLTARVIANRQWAAFFGRGIVSTVDDFGIQGTAPTHPELLDWLAITFMDTDHWSRKALHRRIVLSETYRQSSVRSEKSAKTDPENQWLSFAPRFRLEAEIVRDSIVQAAGVLSKKIGGPPVRPIQPPGITEVAFGSPGWAVSSGDDRYRRSIYTFIKRTAPFAMVTTFDGPSGEACIARRNRSNTPLQALTLLNDPMFVDLAQASGRMLQKQQDPTDKGRITVLFRRLLTRNPDDEELATLMGFVTLQREKFARNLDDARQLIGNSADGTDAISVAEQAAWTAVARAMFSLDEVVMRP